MGDLPFGAMVNSYKVMKFGGSSVGERDSLLQVIRLIEAQRASGPVAVIVSAMGDTTDRLLDAIGAAEGGDLQAALALLARTASLARETASSVAETLGEGGRRDALERIVQETLAPLGDLLHGVSLMGESSAGLRDRILAFGELTAAKLLTELLLAAGLDSCFADARALLITDDRFGDARVDLPASRSRLAAALPSWGGRIPILPGFIGATADGKTTTLGRNGSDYTAALVAQGIGADEVQVWTDVPGLMTADPDLVRDAYSVSRLTHHEALELASVGARMFHPRTLIPVIEAGIRLRIRNTLDPEHPGTTIDARGSRDGQRPSCIATREDLALLDVEVRKLSDQVQVGERVLRALRESGVTVWMSSQSANGQSIAIVVPRTDSARARAALERELAPEFERRELEPVGVREPVTLLSLVAEAMGHGVNVAGRLFGALGSAGVNIRAIAQGASSRSISCVVDAGETALSVRTTHAAFNLAHQQVSLLILGKGTVGKELVEQLRSQQEWLRAHHGISLVVAGLADSRRLVFDEEGLDPRTALAELALAPPVDANVRARLAPSLQRLGRLPVPVLVDCTAAGGMEALYLDAFALGVHVVAANKKPLAIPWEEREALLAAAQACHVAYQYETTVGASLPVIDTLLNLVRTGDKVRLIQASLSGTLGYLCDELGSGVPLSLAVRRARELGFTEPDPREDLAGKDVMRKALILARELGLSVGDDDVELLPFIPAEHLRDEPLDAFYERLEALDPTFARDVDRWRREGKVLRYLAEVDPSRADTGEALVRVGPVAVSLDHPAAGLRGSESMVSFTTDRHHPQPLTVRGAGAGGAVTASGVLTDILRISQTLRGR